MTDFSNQKQIFHPRSPVQAGPSPAPYFVSAVIIALAIWTAQQIWFQDSALSRGQSLAPTGPAPGPSGLKVERIERLESLSRTGRSDLRTLFSSADYPAQAIRDNQEGTVQARLDVDERGRVRRCNVIRSAGPILDRATCTVLTRRARFTPARNSQGQPVAAIVTSPPIIWRLEG